MPSQRGTQQFQGLFEVISVKVSFNPPSLVDGTGTVAGFLVPGTEFGDFAFVSAPYGLQGLDASAYVSSTNNVTIHVQNESGATVDLANGLWNVMVLKPNASFFTV
ncbi:MAG: hypothetical protein ACREYE_23515, partial [Gammaproteobacteria bacterium]